MLDSTESACDRLAEELGGEQLSGQGYIAAKEMFTEAIKPGLLKVKSLVDNTQSDLDKYTQADGLVSKYGNLDEDSLRAQLASVTAQRDATENLIELNRTAADGLSMMPELALMLEATNAQLGIVLSGLEDDIQELRDKINALIAFNSQTAGLFDSTWEEIIQFLGGWSTIAGQALDIANTGVDLARIKKVLAGGKLFEDYEGRVTLSRPGKPALYLYYRFANDMSQGRSKYTTRVGDFFNRVTGQRIDSYTQPLKAAASGFTDSIADIGRDFTGWKGASTLTRSGKILGIFGTVITVGDNAYTYFGDGDVSATDVRDFTIDTAVDFTSAAAAAGFGAAVMSWALPPIGTVIGAGAGLFASCLLNWEFFDGTSVVSAVKDGLKKGCDWVASWFW